MTFAAFAHSGKTDSNGGHYDNSKGEYHYHHGYPPHQHYDMDGDGSKDCAYSFKDTTNSSKGTTKNNGTPQYTQNSIGTTSADKTPYKETSAAIDKSPSKKTKLDIKEVILVILCSPFIGYLVYMMFSLLVTPIFILFVELFKIDISDDKITKILLWVTVVTTIFILYLIILKKI